jgi:hypothetical protein
MGHGVADSAAEGFADAAQPVRVEHDAVAPPEIDDAGVTSRSGSLADPLLNDVWRHTARYRRFVFMAS